MSKCVHMMGYVFAVNVLISLNNYKDWMKILINRCTYILKAWETEQLRTHPDVHGLMKYWMKKLPLFNLIQKQIVMGSNLTLQMSLTVIIKVYWFHTDSFNLQVLSQWDYIEKNYQRHMQMWQMVLYYFQHLRTVLSD